ncbi:MAG: Gfo/Idh/MocA family oxidoreductase [Ruminococcaceae bacterium]|nr:Gfo/Idh/MocA family oxidoreductase [Oscillospiraceae bacterium]
MKKTINVGVIGLGMRGRGMIDVALNIKNVKITMVCDSFAERVEEVQKELEEKTGFRPAGATHYRDVIASGDVDCIMIFSSWDTHVDIAVEAMKAGKYVGMEVGGAYDLEDCWRLVRTHEETGTQLMMLENCCYGERELALLKMARLGKFGRIVHCRASYEHDLRYEMVAGERRSHYRLKNLRHRCGELYPTHGLGPMCNILHINRGNRMVSLTAMSSRAEGIKAWVAENEPADSPLQGIEMSTGDVTTTMIKCAGGETILLTHEITLPRPYSRGNRIDGSGGVYMEDGNCIYLWEEHKEEYCKELKEFFPAGEGTWKDFDEYKEKYAHPIWKLYKEAGIKTGHGGMDYLELLAFFHAVENNEAPPIDVYDAASWMAITCLSEQSIAMGSAPVTIPDFTRGQWLNDRTMIKNPFALDEVYEDEVYENMFD